MVKENGKDNVILKSGYAIHNGVTVDVVKLNELGDNYFYGNGCKRSRKEAVRCYRAAAEAGYAVAQYNLAYCYEEGLGVFKSARKAFCWYRKAAEAGNAKAQNNVGNCYAWGHGTAENRREAFRWYSKSAAQGDQWGEYNLAECYDNGTGVKKDRREAMKWYALSAAQGNKDAEKSMSPAVRRKRSILKMSRRILYVTGALLFIVFMVTNYVDAKAYEIYSDGAKAYANKEYDKAVRLFREAIDEGSAEAINHLGICYERGHGAEKDLSVAYDYFLMSANEGSYQGMYNVGRFHEYGKVVKKDLEKAREWYIKAADLGDPSAKKALENMNKE